MKAQEPRCHAIALPDAAAPYPRVCAHRGYKTIAPENSLPAFGAAVALGAEEIEFDLWETADGEIVSLHDHTLERVSNGQGFVYEKTFDELRQLDFGVKYSDRFRGLEILTFEEILRKFACHTIMNVHIKSLNDIDPLPEPYLRKIVDLIDRYDCRDYVYFMTGNDAVLDQLRMIAPDITRCRAEGPNPWEMVDRAIEKGCRKVQFHKRYLSQEMIDKAHENGMVCNIFWSDDPEETKRFLDMGIDTILSNDYFVISRFVKGQKET